MFFQYSESEFSISLFYLLFFIFSDTSRLYSSSNLIKFSIFSSHYIDFGSSKLINGIYIYVIPSISQIILNVSKNPCV